MLTAQTLVSLERWPYRRGEERISGSNSTAIDFDSIARLGASPAAKQNYLPFGCNDEICTSKQFHWVTSCSAPSALIRPRGTPNEMSIATVISSFGETVTCGLIRKNATASRLSTISEVALVTWESVSRAFYLLADLSPNL
jgi:hypothetical protein